MTGLAVVAFLRAGYTPLSRAVLDDPVTGRSWRTGDAVRRGLAWLRQSLRPDGCVGPRAGTKVAISQAAATWALAEAAALTGDDALRHSAASAAGFLLSLQEPCSGWSEDGRNTADLVATAWAFRALAAAGLAGVEFPRSSRIGIGAFLETLPVSRPFGALDLAYFPRAGKVVTVGRNEDWDYHPIGAAVALLAFPLCHPQSRENDRLFATAVVSDLPQFAGKSIDYHAWNFAAAALALRRNDFPDHATAFAAAAREALLPTQKFRADGCACGSWDVDVDRWGWAGGRVYSTAINAITLSDLANP